MAEFDAIVIGAGHNGLAAAALLQKAGRAHAVPGLQAVRRWNGLHRRAFRRLSIRDRRLAAVPDVGEGQRRARARRAADRRPRRHVGVAAGHRRRARRLLHRSDEAADPPQRRARRRGRQRHGGSDGVEPGARPARWAGSMRACRRRRSTRCTPVPRTNSSARRSPTCCSARSPTCWTATCPTRRSTARCAACSRSSPSTPPTAGPPLPAAPQRWRSVWRCPTRTPS